MVHDLGQLHHDDHLVLLEHQPDRACAEVVFCGEHEEVFVDIAKAGQPADPGDELSIGVQPLHPGELEYD